MTFEKTLALPAPSERPAHIKQLVEMLSYRRPAGSKTERKFISRYIRPLEVQEDKIGNLYKRIGDAPILWSSHTDTVHREGGRQNVRLLDNVAYVADKQSNCLGADCTAGVWMMHEMILAGVPGLYVFHRQEEVGGIGSEHIATKTPELLDGIKYAIAFDRRGKGSIITHQWGGRCCSQGFANSLSDAIGLGHSSDSGGSFTDTASYVDIVAECSNLSVGYENEHSSKETLDINYIDMLREAMISADFSNLVEARKPGETDWDVKSYKGYTRSYGSYTSGGAYGHWLDDDQSVETSGYRKTNRDMVSLVKEHPHEVADWLGEYGVTPDEIASAIWMRGGVLRTS